MRERKPFLAPLAHRTFRNVWLGSITSNLGALIQVVGAAWLMTTISASENMVALVQASTALPIMLFSVAFGAIADNFERKRVMLVAQLFMCTMSALLAACAILGWISPWGLLAFTFLIGCGTALNNPSWQAMVGDMVPREDVPGAVSLNSMGFNLTRSVGPAIGGVIVAVGGAAAAFVANSLCYLGLIITLARWNTPAKPLLLPRENLGRAILAGLRYVSMSPNLMKVYFRGFVFGISGVAVLALMPIVARDVIRGGALTYGLLFGAFGVGAVAGAFFSARLRATLSSENVIRCAFAGFALSEATIAWTSNAMLCFAASMLAGASWVIALSLFNTIVQLSTPRWVVGRALAFYQTATQGGVAAGSWLWGTVAENYSLSTALSVAATMTVAGVLIGFLLPMPVFRSLNLDPLNQFREPELHLDIVPRSGPIAIQIEYEIKSDDLEEFLTVIAERRRIRIRDGAKAWALMRDLENPERWIETYHVPTWVDYVRHNQRRTKADADNYQRLRALQREQSGPKVRRMIERQAIPPAGDVFHQVHTDSR